MRCGNCKYWAAIGFTANEVWEVSKTKDDWRIGICQYNSPFLRGDKNNAGKWPEVDETNKCGQYLPKETEEARLRNKIWEWQGDYYKAIAEGNKYKKQVNAIIRAVKKKYPKIKLRDKAIDKVLEILK